ncbi:hypothetical protein HDU67_003643 [Dinochytrium kinnereticum]|nr:hypothetical protein HDU67_003643 [Dinochytrium kinnereticum]
MKLLPSVVTLSFAAAVTAQGGVNVENGTTAPRNGSSNEIPASTAIIIQSPLPTTTVNAADPSPIVATGTAPAVASPATTTALVATNSPSPSPTVLPGGYPAPESSFQTTASGPVTVLAMPYLVDKVAVAYQKTYDTTPAINISHSFVPDQLEDDAYVQKIRKDCDAKVGNYDVVLINSAFLGSLGDCFLDVSGWDRRNSDGFVDRIWWMNTVDNRLVALPVSSDYGVMFYNQDILEAAEQDFPPLSMDEFEESALEAIRILRMSEKADVIGLTSQLNGEALTIAAAEWLYGQGRTSLIDIEGNVMIATNNAAKIIDRVASWSEKGIIDLQELEIPKAGMDQGEASMDRFINGKAIFMRHWSSSIKTLQAMNLPFKWGVGPIVGTRRGQGAGAHSGVSVGVYRYSKNPSAAVKVAFWLSSVEYQKTLLTKQKLFFIPTRAQLLMDSQVCEELSVDLCQLFAMTTPALRPTAFAGKNYRNVTNFISSAIYDILTGGTSIKNGLESLDVKVRNELKIALANSTINIGTQVPVSGKKEPIHVEVQLSGLVLVIVVTTTVVILLRKRYSENKKKKEVDGNGAFQVLEDKEGDDEEKGEMTQVIRDEKPPLVEISKKKAHQAQDTPTAIQSVSDLGVEKSERASFL